MFYLFLVFNFYSSTIKVYVDKLVAWIRRYIQLSPQNSRPDIRRHGPFYSGCQALFYIFIYRHEELLHSYGMCMLCPYDIETQQVTIHYWLGSCYRASDSTLLVGILLQGKWQSTVGWDPATWQVAVHYWLGSIYMSCMMLYNVQHWGKFTLPSDTDFISVLNTISDGVLYDRLATLWV